MTNIGRNDPCWCGSGIKYKKCHLNRTDQQEVKFWEAAKTFKKSFSTKDCLVPDKYRSECSGKIIQAHSVAKCWLGKIAKDSHVYGFNPGIHSLLRNHGKVIPELIGINNASTFTGFCSAHDKSIFSKIEDEQFTGTTEQCFLLAYRAITREYFTKHSSYSHIPKLRDLDKGKSESSQFALQNIINLHQIGTSAGLKDIESHKSEFETILTSKDYSDLQYYIIEITKTPEVLSSGGVSISFDFDGNRLQDLSDLATLPDSLYYSLIPTDKGGAMVFSWLKSSATSCHRFIRSIHTMEASAIPNSIIRFLFEFCENNYISPVWWDKLESTGKDKILERFNKAMNPFEHRENGCLRDDGLFVVNWDVSEISTNMDQPGHTTNN